MNLAKSFASGIGSSIGSALVGIAVVPVYLRYLGEEAYGLVGFAATIQAVFVLLDLGLSQTLSREVARALSTSFDEHARAVLAAVGKLYWAIGGLLAALVVVGAPWIVDHWLQRRNLDRETAQEAVRWIGVLVFARWPISLYQSALQGALKFSSLNIVNFLAALVQGVGGVFILRFFSNVSALIACQSCIALVHALTLRALAWKAVGGISARRADGPVFGELWRFSKGMVLVTATAIVLSQLDRLLLSSLLSLDDFARYVVATTIARSLYLVTTPVFGVLFPRFSHALAGDSEEKLVPLYRLVSGALAIFLFGGALAISICAEDLLWLWTRNASLASVAAPALVLTLWASALHGVMYVPYALQLASGHPEIPVRINILLCLVTVPVTYLLTTRLGMTGGGAALLTINASYLLLGSYMTHRVVLRELGKSWLREEIGRPLVFSLMLYLGTRLLIESFEISRSGRFFASFIAGLLLVATLVVATPALRSTIRTRLLRSGQ